MKFTPEQKLQILREMETNIYLAFSKASDIFNKETEGLIESYEKKVKETLSSSLSEIEKKELQNIKERIDKAVLKMKEDVEILSLRIPKDGKNGKDGVPGKSGDNGKDGKDGKKGQDGKDGKDGINGSPDKPLEIADKLNTLTEKVQQKVIIGLEKRLKGLEMSIRDRKGGGSGPSGGGMGNTQHETKAVSSATTTVSTTYPISGNGYAIWAYYQGQLIMRGTAYTVGSDRKTLPLLFTPQDDTFIDIIYIR